MRGRKEGKDKSPEPSAVLQPMRPWSILCSGFGGGHHHLLEEDRGHETAQLPKGVQLVATLRDSHTLTGSLTLVSSREVGVTISLTPLPLKQNKTRD